MSADAGISLEEVGMTDVDVGKVIGLSKKNDLFKKRGCSKTLFFPLRSVEHRNLCKLTLVLFLFLFLI